MARLTVGGSGRRALLIAFASTVVFFGLLALLVVNAPGWDQVRRQFFNWDNFFASAPGIVARFEVNVRLFLIAEVLILAARTARRGACAGCPGPRALPAPPAGDRLHRPLPGGARAARHLRARLRHPGARLPGVPNDPFFWGVVALTLVYSAYVAEVYRAGIDSVHPSQVAAARSLGLSQAPGPALRRAARRRCVG